MNHDPSWFVFQRDGAATQVHFTSYENENASNLFPGMPLESSFFQIVDEDPKSGYNIFFS